MRVLVLGDTHADSQFTYKAVELAAQLGCSKLVQVGDFGYWPKDKGGQAFLSFIRKSLKLHGVELVFVRGNHEDHDELERLDCCHGPDELLTPEGFVVIRKPKNGAIYSAPRSGNWVWDGVTFGCLGGAYSIDRRWRTKHVSWFPQELPTQDDVDRLERCEVLFTHDAPQILLPPLGDHRDDESEVSHRMVGAAIDKARPSVVFHGHWHMRTVYGYHGVEVVGLGANVNSLSEAAAVLDTVTRRWYSVDEAMYDGAGRPW